MLSIAYYFLSHSKVRSDHQQDLEAVALLPPPPTHTHTLSQLANSTMSCALWVGCPNHCRDTAGYGKGHQRKQAGLTNSR